MFSLNTPEHVIPLNLTSQRPRASQPDRLAENEQALPVLALCVTARQNSKSQSHFPCRTVDQPTLDILHRCDGSDVRYKHVQFCCYHSKSSKAGTFYASLFTLSLLNNTLDSPCSTPLLYGLDLNCFQLSTFDICLGQQKKKEKKNNRSCQNFKNAK